MKNVVKIGREALGIVIKEPFEQLDVVRYNCVRHNIVLSVAKHVGEKWVIAGRADGDIVVTRKRQFGKLRLL